MSAPAAAPAPVKKVAKKQLKKVATKQHKFVINAAKPVDDKIFSLEAFEKFLNDHIKVGVAGKPGKAGELKGLVSVTRDAKKLSVVAKTAFSKRYLKYLTKKFLKKSQLRDFVRVVADSKNSYDLRYFNIKQQEEESDD